jgi:hypothetical protein
MDPSRLPFPSSQWIFLVQLFRMFQSGSILTDALTRRQPGHSVEG